MAGSTTGIVDRSEIARLVGAKLGNYRLERIVGQGRMGVVYRANDEALLRPTAVKVLSWALGPHELDPVQWFLAEARLVARINHPRVVQIYAVARHGDLPYIAMEYVDGQSAEALVIASGPLAEARALDVLRQAASALGAAHRSGVVHRDVKPANLLVTSDGIAKLTDFGVALSLGEPDTGFAGLRVGTPYYTAPELWSGAAASPASDLYSLGATGFHLVTGRPPLVGRDVEAVREAHLLAAVPDPRELAPGLSPGAAALLLRALAKDPAGRFASAEELEAELLGLLQDRKAARPARSGEADGESAKRLDHDEIRRHLRGRLENGGDGGDGGVPAMLLTPDALLLVELRSGGRTDRVDRLGDNMVLLAAATGRRVLTSFEAWTAPVEARLTRKEAIARAATRPKSWPTPEVKEAIDRCRSGRGLPPFPQSFQADSE